MYQLDYAKLHKPRIHKSSGKNKDPKCQWLETIKVYYTLAYNLHLALETNSDMLLHVLPQHARHPQSFRTTVTKQFPKLCKSNWGRPQIEPLMLNPMSVN